MATVRSLYSKYGTIQSFCATMNQESIFHQPFVLHFNNQTSCYLALTFLFVVLSFFLVRSKMNQVYSKDDLLKIEEPITKKTLTCISAPAFSCALMQWYSYIVALVYPFFHILMHWHIFVLIYWSIYILIHLFMQPITNCWFLPFKLCYAASKI